MSDEVMEIRIEVAGEDDPVRDERAARGLRDELLGLNDVLSAAFAPPDSPSPPGAKGLGASDSVVLLATVASPAAATVIAVVRAWAERSRHRKVVVSAEGFVEVHGGIGRREQQLVHELALRERSGHRQGDAVPKPSRDERDG